MCDVNVTMLYPTHGAEPDVLSHGAANRRVIPANTRHSPRVVPMLGRLNEINRAVGHFCAHTG